MTELKRDPDNYSQASYDLIIIGGGIYGAMLAYEAVRRNLKPLLLEQNDFNNATSLNHLRTVHGGLRYLQNGHLPRFFQSVKERKWFLQYFPQYVEPMPCMLPLYGKGLQRNTIMRPALWLNDILSISRNLGVSKAKHLPGGKVISRSRTRELFPAVDSDGLTGAAVWYDAAVQEFQRLFMDLLKIAASRGAHFLNYMTVNELVTQDNSVTGVRALDEESGKHHQFNAPVVINAAGPWCRNVAQSLDRDHVPLFKNRLLVWNVLFNRKAPSAYALGLAPGKGKGAVHFFHPWKNRLLVGTGEMPVQKSETETQVPQWEIQRFIADVNKMVPGLNLEEKDIQRIYSGILPADERGGMSKKPTSLRHREKGGPNGLFSISGVKFTTSRLVADDTLNDVFPKATKMSHQELINGAPHKPVSFAYDEEPTAPSQQALLKEIIDTEQVVRLSDLVLRRTSLGDHPQRALAVLPLLKPLFNRTPEKWAAEVDQLKEQLQVKTIEN